MVSWDWPVFFNRFWPNGQLSFSDRRQLSSRMIRRMSYRRGPRQVKPQTLLRRALLFEVPRQILRLSVVLSRSVLHDVFGHILVKHFSSRCVILMHRRGVLWSWRRGLCVWEPRVLASCTSWCWTDAPVLAVASPPDFAGASLEFTHTSCKRKEIVKNVNGESRNMILA